jgi:hypothetical protein
LRTRKLQDSSRERSTKRVFAASRSRQKLELNNLKLKILRLRVELTRIPQL